MQSGFSLEQLKDPVSVKLFEGKKEETAFQRSCRYMATQRCNLSVARIDLNALDLQRREAVVIWFSGSIYNKKMNPANTCGMAIKGPNY